MTPTRTTRTPLPARALAAFVAATLLAAGAVALAAPAAADEAPVSRYTALTPQRLVDSRLAGGTPLRSGETRTLQLGDTLGAGVTAVVLNLTAVDTTRAGYLTMWPTGANRPDASNVQTLPGEIRAVSVTVAVAHVDGRPVVDLYNSSGTTDYVIDLFGTYNTDASNRNWSSFYPVSYRQRVLDTRSSGGALRNGATRNVVLDNALGNAVEGATAVAVNITAVNPRSAGYLAPAGTGTGSPVSNVNFVSGRTAANFAVLPASCADVECATVRIGVRNVSAGTDVLIDVLGFYSAPGQGGGGSYVPVVPFRITDSRAAYGFSTLGPRGIGTAFPIPMSGPPLPTPMAVNATVTALRPTAATYLTVWPRYFARPGASTLNPLPGQLLSNATQIGTAGNPVEPLGVYNNAGTTDVLIDVNGLFVPDTGA